MDYTLIYSDRKTISVSVKGCVLTVRAPKKTPKKIIDNFLAKHLDWITKHMKKAEEHADKFENLTEEEVLRLKKEARVYLRAKTKHYSEIMGLKYGRITITSAKTRFGSCSSQGNISYSYRLMLCPEKAREYVVVHELAHLVEMNHSKKFYSIIEKILPDYKERRRMLR